MPRAPKTTKPGAAGSAVGAAKAAATAPTARRRRKKGDAEDAPRNADGEETGEGGAEGGDEAAARPEREDPNDEREADQEHDDGPDAVEEDKDEKEEKDDAGTGREIAAPSSASIARYDPMAAYLREVQRHPLLTPEQTHELAVRYVTTQDAASAARLVTSNLRLVVKIAYEYRRAYKNIMDLVQEGNIGLMQAVKRYDPYRGVKLSSYSAWWIRAYILRFILNNWRLVKLGTTQAQRKLFFNLRKKRAELVSMGIDPTNAEIAKQLNVPEADVAEMDVRLTSNEKSLDAPVGDAEGRSIAKVDMMPSLEEGPESMVADEELQTLLKAKLASFRETLVGKDKEIAIFDERLVAEDPLTLQELGDRFGISRERVRQLEQRLTSRLREYLKQEMGDATEVG